MAKLKTAAEVIDALGGYIRVSELLAEDPHLQDVEPNTVSTWRRRGFPTWVRGNMRILCEGKDGVGVIDAEPELFVIRAPDPRRRAA